MNRLHSLLALLFLTLSLSLGLVGSAFAGLVKGIYLTQSTLEQTSYLKYLIRNSKAAGIGTFVIDMEIPSRLAEKNIQLVKEAGIEYVARIIVFPQGGFPAQIENPAYWEKRYRLVQTALNYGADQIQLDYIRYSSRLPANPDHARNILKVVQYFKDRIRTTSPGTPLQLDVFGVTSFGESKHIGQNIKMLSQSVEALCPMVYPSHYEPYRQAAVTPYETIYRSLTALKKQFGGEMPFKLYPFIEISNYRYPLSNAKRRAYVLAEIKAVKDAGANGFYVWSAHNKYDFLFSLLTEISKEETTAGSILQKTLEAQAEKPKLEVSHTDIHKLPVDVSVAFTSTQPTLATKPVQSNSRFFVY